MIRLLICGLPLATLACHPGLNDQVAARSTTVPSPQTAPAMPRARTVVFVCDATGSMINKIARLKIELMLAVQSLRPIDSFDIIFYQNTSVLKLGDDMLSATPENKQKAEVWLDGVTTDGTCDPVAALTFGLKLRPRLLYFVTDAADFPDVPAVQNVFRTLNAGHRTKVNTSLIVETKEEQEANKDSEPLMRSIASENGGYFQWVRTDELK